MAYIITSVKDFKDSQGNEIIGDAKGAKIKFQGNKSKLTIGKNFFNNQNLRINLGTNSHLAIGDDVKLEGVFNISVASNAQVKLGNKVKMGNTNLSAHTRSVLEFGDRCKIHRNGTVTAEEDSKIIMGEFVTFRINPFIVAHQKTSIIIGNNCMFAANIHIRSDDGHSLFDLNTKTRINSEQNRSVILGDNVWVAYESSLMYGTDIGSGSVVATRSVVKDKFPENSLIAGSIATLKKEGITWHRENSMSADEFFSE